MIVITNSKMIMIAKIPNCDNNN